MSSTSPASPNRQRRAAIVALRNLLLYELKNEQTDLLSLLSQLNIETDSSAYHHQNSMPCSAAHPNYNNSSVPIEIDTLSATDLQCQETEQASSFYLSHSQPFRLQSDNLSGQQRHSSNNSSRKSRSRRRKQKLSRANKHRKKNENTPVETGKFHYRNMITVRRISCHNVFNPPRKRFEYEWNKYENEIKKNERSKKIKSANLFENKSQKYQTRSTGFKSSPPLIQLHASSTTPMSDHLIQQHVVNKKMANSPDTNESKVTSLRDSSIISLVSTHIPTTVYDQTKADVTSVTSATSGSQNELESLADHSARPSTTSPSIVPHFSSTIAPYVSHPVSSSIIPTSKPEAIPVSTSPDENIRELVDQLKTCIHTLRLLLKHKTEHEKLAIPNVKSPSDHKRIRRKKKHSPSSLSFSSTSKNNLIFEDITVTRCNSPINHDQRGYQSHIPTSGSNHPDELQRCLLVYCRNRGRNINSNERQKKLHSTRNHSASKEHIILSQSSQSVTNNTNDALSMSKSTLILAEENDDYDDDENESLNRLFRVSSL